MIYIYFIVVLESSILHVSFVEIGSPVLEKKILKVFTMYGFGGHLGHVTWIFICTLVPSSYGCFTIKFGFDWPTGFRGEDL